MFVYGIFLISYHLIVFFKAMNFVMHLNGENINKFVLLLQIGLSK